MLITASRMLDKVRREVKDTDGTNYPPEELYQYLNQAVRYTMTTIAAIWSEYLLRADETNVDQQNVVDGTPNYDLPARCYLIAMVTLEDSDGDTTELDPLTFARTLDSDAEGYFLRDNDLWIYPTIDANVTNGLTIYYVERPAEVRGSTNVPYSGDFEDAMVEWMVMKCKARQEERVADFAAIYAMIQASLNAMVVKTNNPREEAGMHVSWRDWI